MPDHSERVADPLLARLRLLLPDLLRLRLQLARLAHCWRDYACVPWTYVRRILVYRISIYSVPARGPAPALARARAMHPLARGTLVYYRYISILMYFFIKTTDTHTPRVDHTRMHALEHTKTHYSNYERPN